MVKKTYRFFERIAGMQLIPELALNGLIFFVCLLLFVLLFLPREALERRIVSDIKAASQNQLSLTGFHLTPTLAFRADSLTYSPAARGRSETESDITVKNLTGSPGRLRLIFGQLVISAQGKLAGGTVNMTANQGESIDQWNIDVDGEDIAIGEITTQPEPLRIAGKASLNGTMLLEKGVLSAASGVLQGKDIKLNDLIVREFTISELLADSLALEANYENNEVTIAHGSVSGPDLNADIDGSITLRNPIENSVLKLNAAVSIMPDFLTKNNLSFLSGLMIAQRNNKISIPIKGTFQNPKIDFNTLMPLAKPLP